MTTSLRDALTQRINQVGPADPDLEELVGLGEQRLRRRRLTAVAGTGAVVALAIAVAIGGAPWSRSAGESPGPIHHPHQTQTTTPAATRPLVYSDDVEYQSGKGDAPGLSIHVGTVHVGDGQVDIDQTGIRSWGLVVTDAGVLYSNDEGNPWFSDGGPPRRIPVCGGGAESGSSGSLAMWFDCERDLVVFDTASGEEVARKPLPFCWNKGWSCVTYDLVGQHAYFVRYGVRRSAPELLYMFDASTGQVARTSGRTYADDLRAGSHALVIGDSWRTGGVSTEADFAVAGSRLVPTHSVSGPPGQPDPGSLPTKAFDVATGKPVRLHFAGDYAPGPLPDFKGDQIPGPSTTFHLFEWLDRDTVALVQGDYHFGDILTCHLSDGVCRLAVSAGPPDRVRMVPGASFPE